MNRFPKINTPKFTYGPMFNELFNKDWFNYLTSDEHHLNKDDDGNYHLEVEVPGFNSDNLEVTYNKGYVLVNGKTDKRELNKELYIGSLSNKDVNAVVKDGLLTLTFKGEINQENKIPIENG